MGIPCLCLFRLSSCAVHPKTAVIPVDIPTRWEPRTNQSNGLRLLIFPQPFGRALKNQNAAPTTPPCFSRWLRSSSLHWADCLLCRLASSEPPCSSPGPPTTKKVPRPFGLGTRGGRYRTRTCDLLHVKQMLYQLS